MRDKRAQGIAAMGLVTREGEVFTVKTPSLRGRTASYEVRREEGKVTCSCLEFDEARVQGVEGFRCEHILAVKHHLLAKASPAAKLGAPPAQEATSDPLHPSATVLTHLGSLIVHLEEFLDSIPGGAASLYSAASFDVAAIRSSLNSKEVEEWREGMKRLALLPVKRSDKDAE
jgi:hypothetical protein